MIAEALLLLLPAALPIQDPAPSPAAATQVVTYVRRDPVFRHVGARVQRFVVPAAVRRSAPAEVRPVSVKAVFQRR